MARAKRQLINIDRASRVLIRGKKAVPLSTLEFNVFIAMASNRSLYSPPTTRSLLNVIYDGVKEPPLHARTVLTSIITRLSKKLNRIGVTIVTENHGRKTTRRLVRAA